MIQKRHTLCSIVKSWVLDPFITLQDGITYSVIATVPRSWILKKLEKKPKSQNKNLCYIWFKLIVNPKHESLFGIPVVKMFPFCKLRDMETGKGNSFLEQNLKAWKY